MMSGVKTDVGVIGVNENIERGNLDLENLKTSIEIINGIGVDGSIQLNSLESKSNPLSIIDLSVPGYFRKSAIINSNTIIIDMDTIKQSESDYFLTLKPTLRKCEYIIDEEINNFVLNHKHRYNLRRAQIAN